MDTVMSEMEQVVNRNLLKYAAGTALFCPCCQTVMDCTRTVTFDVIRNGQPLKAGMVRCTRCYDSLCTSLSTANGFCFENVVDGRILFPHVENTPKAPAPVEKAAFNVKTVQVGHTYFINHTSGYVPVTILHLTGHDVRDYGWGSRGVIRRNTRYVCRNEKTGREIIVKSAAKFRYEVVMVDGKWRRV